MKSTWILKKNNIPAMKLEMAVMMTYIRLYGYEVIEASLMPKGLQIAYEKGVDLTEPLSAWLDIRRIPDSRVNLDYAMHSLYRIPFSRFGRMNGFQWTAAALSFFASEFDDYTLVPEKELILCHAGEDPAADTLYYVSGKEEFSSQNTDFITKDKYESVIRASNAGEIEIPKTRGFFDSKSWTIQSNHPSWWEYRREKKILCQEIWDGYEREYRETDYTAADQVSWLYEFIYSVEAESVEEYVSKVADIFHVEDTKAIVEIAYLSNSAQGIGFMPGKWIYIE